jgi:hypothetical protein
MWLERACFALYIVKLLALLGASLPVTMKCINGGICLLFLLADGSVRVYVSPVLDFFWVNIMCWLFQVI